MIDLKFAEFFEWSPCCSTRGHRYKLYKKICAYACQVYAYLSERFDNSLYVNELPENVLDFKSLLLAVRNTSCAETRQNQLPFTEDIAQ